MQPAKQPIFIAIPVNKPLPSSITARAIHLPRTRARYRTVCFIILPRKPINTFYRVRLLLTSRDVTYLKDRTFTDMHNTLDGRHVSGQCCPQTALAFRLHRYEIRFCCGPTRKGTWGIRYWRSRGTFGSQTDPFHLAVRVLCKVPTSASHN